MDGCRGSRRTRALRPQRPAGRRGHHHRPRPHHRVGPTIKALAEAGAKVIVTAHLGRPRASPTPSTRSPPSPQPSVEYSVAHVQLAGDVVGADALARAEGLTDGDVLLLENIRFDARETSKDDAERLALATALAELVGHDGAFVSDGFGVVHRKQASVYDVATLLPHYAGGLVATEVKVLEQLTSSTAQAVRGGVGRLEGLGQAGGHRDPRHQGRQPRHRRRNVLHVPCRTRCFGWKVDAAGGDDRHLRQASRAITATSSTCRWTSSSPRNSPPTHRRRRWPPTRFPTGGWASTSARSR